VRANPNSEDDLHRLAKTCARVAGMLAELAAQNFDGASFDESLALHQRTAELYSRLSEQNPQNTQFRRNLADGLIMTSYARVLAGQELDRASEEISRALKIEEALAAADPSNVEAEQDLSFAYSIAGRVFQARRDFENAARNYRKCLYILEPLVRQHPDNVETAFDLERARRGLAETEGAAAR
jgi:tetratricopeptide (TPR) repeat protein